MATKWGIVSAGNICHDFTTGLRGLPQAEHQVAAVASRNLESAKKFADLHKIPKAYGSYEELANDPDIEVAYIGCINKYHVPLAKLMLESGKHVVVETPMAISVRETVELQTLAKEKKRFLMELHWSRFLPSYEFFLDQIKKGVIGDVVHVSVNFGLPIAHIERIASKELGGGAMMDIGIYTVNLLNLVFQEEKPVKISAVGQLNKYGADVSTVGSFLYSNGKTASVVITSAVQLPCEAIIVGTKGTIKLPGEFHNTDTVIVNDKVHKFPYPPDVVPVNYTNSSGLRYEAMEVRRCIKAGLLESERLTHENSKLIATICAELLRQIGLVYE